jgi:hypothetical protein
MAMLTADQLAEIRDEIGSAPDDAVLQTTYTRVGTLGGTIYSVLSRRLADLMAAPSSFAIPGEYSQSTQANIAALMEQLKRWSAFAPNQASLETLQLLSRHSRTDRHDPRRAFDVEAF